MIEKTGLENKNNENQKVKYKNPILSYFKMLQSLRIFYKFADHIS